RRMLLLLLVVVIARSVRARRNRHRRSRLTLVQDDEVPQQLLVQLQQALELRQRFRRGVELHDHIAAGRLLSDGIGELTTTPVVTGGDLARAVLCQQLMVAIQLLLDRLVGELWIKDVDDFVASHDSSGLCGPLTWREQESSLLV